MLTSDMLQGIDFNSFVHANLGYDVAMLLCCPLQFVKDASCDRSRSHGSCHIKWGPLDDEGQSDLDVTAEVWECYKQYM